MKYMLLIHQGTTPTPGTEAWERLSQEEQGAVYAAYKALNETPGFTAGERMQDPETATTVRVQDGRTLTTDGPFTETKEHLGGFAVVDVPDDAEARYWAGRIAVAVGWPQEVHRFPHRIGVRTDTPSEALS